ncbi:MAG: SNF2-related protein [Saprospiraceae bacterium]
MELDDLRRQLFQWIEELQPDFIVRKFHKTKKKAPSLHEMLEDRELTKAIQLYVHRLLDKMLRLIAQHQLPLTLEVDRRVLVKDFTLQIMPHPLTPELFFAKKPDSVSYRLRLSENGQPWPITGRDVVAFTNLPTGWVAADYQLYRLEHINGFLVKPFRQREEVTIPAASVNTYFRNFILKIVNKVDIEADGFEVVQNDTLQYGLLQPVQHLFSSEWRLSLSMVYAGDGKFGWKEQRNVRTTMEIQGEDVRIIQVKRDQAQEAALLEKLLNFPLSLPEGESQFQLDTPLQHEYALVEWLSEHRTALEVAGFQVELPLIGDKELSIAPWKLDMEMDTSSDWFDLKGIVTVGSFQFPFLSLTKYIREQNPFYPLPDGTWFLIPEEWMTRYRQLADFGQKEGDKLRITKSQYTLLEALNLPQPTDLEAVDTPAYMPSSLLKAQLRPYQLEGVRWLAKLHHQQLGGCLADDMGLGKTLQTIAILLYAKEQKAARREAAHAAAPVVSQGIQLGLFAPQGDEDFLQPLNALIILPASLMFNWESEVKKFVPSLTVYAHFGPKRHQDIRLLSRFDVIITTYQTAQRDVKILDKMEFEYIVLDESQQIKNRESKVFKAINSLNARHKISLSGTPIENSLSDLWSQMQFINDGLLGNFNFFRKEFILPIEKARDEDKKEELRKLVTPYLLRRTKEEVAKDLPPLSTQVVFTEMTPEQRKVYEREKSAARNYLLGTTSMPTTPPTACSSCKPLPNCANWSTTLYS